MTYLEELIRGIPNGLYYLAGAWVVWEAARFYFVRFCRVEKGVESITAVCAKLETRLSKIETVLDRICHYLAAKEGLSTDFFSANSPMMLNDLAKRLLVESGGKDFANDQSEVLIAELENRAPKTKLDVQQTAVLVVFDSTVSDKFNRIKDFIYQNPIYEGEKIELTTLVNIIALYLRDKYLEKHPEL